MKRQKTSPVFPSMEDGDGDVDATMNAGTGLMLSFMGQQDKAEQVTDVLSKVMNFIEPFQEYVSLMKVLVTLANPCRNCRTYLE